jgi:hypothetical protein
MALPQNVLNQLNNEPVETPGWFWGVLVFSVAILGAMLAVYFGMKFLYEPYLNSRITSAQTQINALSQSAAANNDAQLVTFYSQISNLQSVLATHVTFSRFLNWLQQNTESNLAYTQLSFTSSASNQITLSATAATEADVNQQIAIFQSSPEVESVSVTNIGTVGAGGNWQFGVSLIMNPDLFTAPNNHS